jgi:nucleoside-diphosphate-sugar epimerase
MTSTLVTGASGFVGSFLLKELTREGIPARGVSRTETDGLITVPSYGKDMDWDPLLKDIDTVVHLAARVHVMEDHAVDPLAEFRQANLEATLHLARAAARVGVRRFIFISTIKVNGETTKPGRAFKADDPRNPDGPYAVSKAEAEIALLDLAKSSSLEVVILRPPLVYGPGVKGNMATLARWARFHLPSPFGSVENRRSLVHVSNLCSAIIAAQRHPGAANQVFLVADSEPVSTHQLLLDLGWACPPKVLNWVFAVTAVAPLAARKSTRDRLLCNLEVDIEKTRTQL